MTIVTQIEDRGAAVAWSPVQSHADVLALGTKDSGGVGFDEYGGELELYDLNMSNPDGGTPKPRVIGSTKTTSRFASIGWSHSSAFQRFQMGLICGGMIDGTVGIWDAASLLSSSSDGRAISSMSQHSGGAVSALQFNPHPSSPHHLGTGGSDGRVLITSLEKPESPHAYSPATDQPNQRGEITQIAWNTQVEHIVASSAGDGTAMVWDLRQRKPWCELRCEAANTPVSDLAWNPTQGLHLITASGDDRNAVLKLWDLRASTNMPLTSLEGHSQGVLSVSWCPHDDTLLASCGKDNRTILWDVFSLKPVADIPNDDPVDQNVASTYGGLSSSQQKRYDVKWSPIRRGIISTCSFDRKVQTHSVIGLATKSGRPPKWMKPASGVSCGFGGSVVSFGSSNKVVNVSTYVEEPQLKALSMRFEESIAGGDHIGFCRGMAEQAKNAGNTYEAQVWGFMQVIFEANAREQLLQYLGFNPQAISRLAKEFSENQSEPPDVSNLSIGSTPRAPMTAKAENAVKQALLVGDFEAAVECCFRSGNFADALVLASCGGAELWAKTQAEYFAREAQHRPYLSVVSAVIHNQLEDLVASSDPYKWHETLAILSTYGKADEFQSLCMSLGNRLEQAGDSPNASLCYMCALSLQGAVRYWKNQFDDANKEAGSLDLTALHSFVEKVAMFLQAMDPSSPLEPEVAELFYQYAKALSEQGLFVSAAKYCRSDSQECKELRDRLYRSKDSHRCAAIFGGAPEFPFGMKNVGVAPRNASTKKTVTNKSASVNKSTAGTYGTKQPSSTQNSTDQLPAGWIALQDPSSRRTYYCNQSTGVTTWDRPAETPQSTSFSASGASYQQNNSMQNQPTQQEQPAQQQQPTYGGASSSYQQTSHQQQQQQSLDQPQQSTAVNGTAEKSVPSKMASRYGDGFVTSASHPELAEQYGNVGTSNPYTGAARPGTATVSKVEKPPVSDTFNPDKLPPLSVEQQEIVDDLVTIVTSLSSVALYGTEKKQLSEIQKGVAVFSKRLARGDINADIVPKVGNIVNAVKNRDYGTAGGIQTSLVNSDWRDHKDWLKGIKFLIQLGSKKL